MSTAVTIPIKQDKLISLLNKVHCAAQSTGAISEPGILLLTVKRSHLVGHVQSRHLVATSWIEIAGLDPKLHITVAVDFQRLYQIVNTHEEKSEFKLTFDDPAFLHISSDIGAWKLITNDLESYYQRNLKGILCGEIEIENFNKMCKNASILSNTSKRSAIDNGVRLYHSDGSLNMFFFTGTEAALLTEKLQSPLSKDFNIFIKSWVLKHLTIPGQGQVKLSLNEEDDVLIFNTADTKIAVSVTTDVSMGWEDATQRMENSGKDDRNEFVSISQIALKASLARLSKVSEGTIDLQLKDSENANLHSELRAGDCGDEKIHVDAGVVGKKNVEPTATSLVLSLNILKSITKLNTRRNNKSDLVLEYDINTKTALASVALFKGIITGTPIEIQVVFPVGRE